MDTISISAPVALSPTEGALALVFFIAGPILALILVWGVRGRRR